MARGVSSTSLTRFWRRFRRRPPLLQAATVAVVVVVLAGVVYGVAGRPPTSSSPTTAAGTGPSAADDLSQGPVTPVPPDQASTSSRGVTSSTINVVFPVANLNGLASQFGFAGDPEDAEQVKAIKFYVSQVNRGGGINGRKINAIIANYDPTNEAEMRALCKDWTEGSPAAFAVIDGLGSWNGDNQLCITQEGHTPLIGEWTTVTDWTTKGSPYLWWLGPDQAAILKTVVAWADSSGYIGTGKTLGIVAGDRASDQLALNDYLLPDLKAAGITHPVVQTIVSNPSDTAATSAQAPLIVQRFRAAGVTSVIPLLPVNSFFPYLLAESSQEFFPRLLLSDYESTIEIGLGLVPAPFEQAIDNQEGVTVQTLGGIDDDRPESEGGYDPGVRSCFDSFRTSRTYPFPEPGHSGPWIEEQGPIVSWCQGIGLFAQAARNAGRHLTRRTFVEAMADITNYPGTLSPILSFGSDKFYGPVEYRVVRIHNNSASDNQCINNYKGGLQLTCWVLVQNWQPLATSP